VFKLSRFFRARNENRTKSDVTRNVSNVIEVYNGVSSFMSNGSKVLRKVTKNGQNGRFDVILRTEQASEFVEFQANKYKKSFSMRSLMALWTTRRRAKTQQQSQRTELSINVGALRAF